MKILKNWMIAGGMLALSAQGDAAPVWDTMPSSNTNGGYFTGVQTMWTDLAVGFSVEGAGHIKRIDAALTPSRGILGYWPSTNGFVVGIADNSLIGNPNNNYLYAPPVGSLWETNACSTTRTFPTHGAIPCEWVPGLRYGIEGVVKMAEGEFFGVDTNIYLPAAGTYWLYARYIGDDVQNSWKINTSVKTDLVATRIGINPTDPVQSAFAMLDGPTYAPGMRIDFEVTQVPEPSTLLLVAAGLAAMASRRQIRGHSPLSEDRRDRFPSTGR